MSASRRGNSKCLARPSKSNKNKTPYTTEMTVPKSISRCRRLRLRLRLDLPFRRNPMHVLIGTIPTPTHLFRPP